MFSRLKDTAVSRDLVNADMLSQQISLIEDVLKGCKWKWTLFLRLHTPSFLFLFLILLLEFTVSFPSLFWCVCLSTLGLEFLCHKVTLNSVL